MKVPLSWLREHADLPAVTAREVADKLTAARLKLESITSHGHDVKNVVVGEVRCDELGHLATERREVELRKPAVEDPVGVVDLPVPHEVHDRAVGGRGGRHGTDCLKRT